MHTHITEGTWGVVQHSIDAHGLLEHAEHDAYEDTHGTVGHQLLGLYHHRFLDFRKDDSCLAAAIYLGEDVHSLVVLAYRNKVARSLRNKADEQGKESRRNGFASKHIAPTGCDCPLCCGIDGGNALAHFLYQRLNVVAKDEEVHEIDHQLSKDDGKLVPRHKHTSYLIRRNFTDIHRADGRSQADSDAADDAIDIEHHEQ